MILCAYKHVHLHKPKAKRVYKNMHVRINIRKHAYDQACMRSMKNTPVKRYKHAHTGMMQVYMRRRTGVHNDHLGLRLCVHAN